MSSEITPTDTFEDLVATKLGDFLWEEITAEEDMTVLINTVWVKWIPESVAQLARKFMTEIADDIQKYKAQLLDEFEDDMEFDEGLYW